MRTYTSPLFSMVLLLACSTLPKNVFAQETAVPEVPSSGIETTTFQKYRGGGYYVSVPEAWRPRGSKVFAPDDGIAIVGGVDQIKKGMVIALHKTNLRNLSEATDELINKLRKENPGMVFERGSRRSIEVDGEKAESLQFTNDSPLGKETDWVITTSWPGGIVYIILIAPSNEFNAIQPTYQRIVDSLVFDSHPGSAAP